MTRVVVVRHGNTFEPGEESRRIGARTDLPLTAGGERQADDLGRWFAARSIWFATVTHGTLRRSADTAALIVRHQADGAEAVAATWLDEIDYGPDENMPEDRVVERIGHRALNLWDREGTAPSGWAVDAAERVAAWRDLFETADIDRLVVTSNGVARFALLALAELARPPSLKLATGAAGEFRRGTDGEPAWRLAYWNRRPPPADGA